jgi:hypothetical protein
MFRFWMAGILFACLFVLNGCDRMAKPAKSDDSTLLVHEGCTKETG